MLAHERAVPSVEAEVVLQGRIGCKLGPTLFAGERLLVKVLGQLVVLHAWGGRPGTGEIPVISAMTLPRIHCQVHPNMPRARTHEEPQHKPRTRTQVICALTSNDQAAHLRSAPKVTSVPLMVQSGMKGPRFFFPILSPSLKQDPVTQKE